MRKNKPKQKKNFEYIAEILNPKKYIGNKNNTIRQNFFHFMSTYQGDSFSTIIKVLIKDDVIKASHNYNNTDVSSLFKNYVYSANNVDVSNLINLYKEVIKLNYHEINTFEKYRQQIEHKISQGKYELAHDDI